MLFVEEGVESCLVSEEAVVPEVFRNCSIVAVEFLKKLPVEWAYHLLAYVLKETAHGIVEQVFFYAKIEIHVLLEQTCSHCLYVVSCESERAAAFKFSL